MYICVHEKFAYVHEVAKNNCLKGETIDETFSLAQSTVSRSCSCFTAIFPECEGWCSHLQLRISSYLQWNGERNLRKLYDPDRSFNHRYKPLEYRRTSGRRRRHVQVGI